MELPLQTSAQPLHRQYPAPGKKGDRTRNSKKHTPRNGPHRPDQIHNLRLDARRITGDAETGVRRGGRGRGQADAREEAVFGEDGDGVEEEDGDCVCRMRR